MRVIYCFTLLILLNCQSTTEKSEVEKDAIKADELKIDIPNKPDSVLCNIDELKRLRENLKSLNTKEIDSFFKIFSEGCKNNVEYQEWSNELLFEIISSYPLESMNLLNDSTYETEVIYEELKSPVTDKFLPKDIIENIKSLSLTNKARDSVINSLEIAQLKY